jgi:Ca2+-binding EF-hand superfamily protein
MIRHAAARVAVLSAAVGFAAGAGAQGPELDGDTTLSEVRAESHAVFDRLAGPDGTITRADLAAAEIDLDAVPEAERAAFEERLFNALDADGDGSVTRAEWDERLSQDLSFADADGDGRITLEELAAARDELSAWEALGLMF